MYCQVLLEGSFAGPGLEEVSNTGSGMSKHELETVFPVIDNPGMKRDTKNVSGSTQ